MFQDQKSRGKWFFGLFSQFSEISLYKFRSLIMGKYASSENNWNAGWKVRWMRCQKNCLAQARPDEVSRRPPSGGGDNLNAGVWGRQSPSYCLPKDAWFTPLSTTLFISANKKRHSNNDFILTRFVFYCNVIFRNWGWFVIPGNVCHPKLGEEPNFFQVKMRRCTALQVTGHDSHRRLVVLLTA